MTGDAVKLTATIALAAVAFSAEARAACNPAYPDDGCPAAQRTGAFQIPWSDFASKRSGVLPSGLRWEGATQNGQVWKVGQPARDVPGISYPIAYRIDMPLTAVEAATTGTGYGQIPPPCKYSANPNFPLSGGMRLYCGGFTVPTMVRGLDLSADNPLNTHGCVPIVVGANVTALFSVANNKIGGCPNSDIANGSLVVIGGGPGFYFGFNAVDGHGSTGKFGVSAVTDNGKTGTAVDEFNYYIDVSARVFTSNRPDVRNRNNVVSGLNTTVSPLHGEFGLPPSQPGSTYENADNVIVFDLTSQANTTGFYMTGAKGMRFARASAHDNIFVSNKNSAGVATVSSLFPVVGGANPQYDKVVIARNLGDMSGALAPQYPYPNPATNPSLITELDYSCNVNMLTGAPLGGFAGKPLTPSPTVTCPAVAPVAPPAAPVCPTPTPVPTSVTTLARDLTVH
jgi:hypothetical protein